MGSVASLDPGYELDHNAIVSTGLLRDYFRDQGIGVYRPEGPGEAGTARSSTIAITPAATVTTGELQGRDRRRLLFYARPRPRRTQPLRAGIMASTEAILAGHFRGGGTWPGSGTWTGPGADPARSRRPGCGYCRGSPSGYAGHATPVRRRPGLMYARIGPGPPRDGGRRS